jgi:putative transposase
MKYNPEKHHRRSIRLKDYDYSQCGAYFVTICTQERLCFFGDAIDSVVVLNATGKMIEKTFAQLPEKYPGIQIDAFVVMPNHIHGIILIGTDSSVGAVPRGRPLSTSNENDNRLAGKIEIRDEGQPQID